MTQRISKHGTKYTVGSNQTFGGWEPRNCTVCGKRVLAKSGFFSSERGSFHHECLKEQRMSEGAWWDAFTESGGLPDLETWLGGVDAASRVRVRERIAECGYTSVLDCGAGLGHDQIGMKNLAHPVRYQGMEPSEKMREAAQALAKSYYQTSEVPIVAGSIEKIPFADNEFDLVYARHIWEHLPRFELALHEMIRVALLEVIVVFFMRPGAESYLFRERDGLWQNRYAKHDIEAELAGNDAVEVFFWETLGTEALLHVYLQASVAVDPEKVAERIKA